jgi:hypothetical protein
MGKRRETESKVSKARDVEDEDPEAPEEEEEGEGGPQIKPKLVSNFIKMWPRAIFSTPAESQGERGKRPAVAKTIKELHKPGVYILYREDQPFYVGQAKNLFNRIWKHAQSVGGARTYFWNYFSAFTVDDVNHIDEVEAIIIAAMPAVVSNSARPRLPRLRMAKSVKNVLITRRELGLF